MNYLKIYESIVSRAKSREGIRGYTERHHVVPKCMGGGDERENIVVLTAREHYLCHWLLYKIHGTSKLAHAWWKMMSVGPGQKREFTSHAYEGARRAHSEAVSERMRADNPFKGKQHTDATKAVISAKNRAHGSNIWNVRSPESKARYMAAVSRPKSEEHRQKIGRKGLVMLQNIYTMEIVRVHRGSDLGPNWVNPKKLKPEKKRKCQNCDMITTASMLKRWHDDKCKQRKLYEN